MPKRSAFPAVWQLKHKEYYPELPPSPVNYLTWKILHQYALNWTMARQEGEFMDFLEWIFANWSALGAGVFRWMKDFPNVPCVRIITNAKLRGFIEEAYTEKEWWARWRKLSDYERMVLHLVQKRGMTQEKAEEFAARRTGYEDEKKEIAKARREVELLAARSQQAITQERAVLARQRRANNNYRKPLKQTEGSFGKFEP